MEVEEEGEQDEEEGEEEREDGEEEVAEGDEDDRLKRVKEPPLSLAEVPPLLPYLLSHSLFLA